MADYNQKKHIKKKKPLIDTEASDVKYYFGCKINRQVQHHPGYHPNHR
jgi:hypothetical protein